MFLGDFMELFLTFIAGMFILIGTLITFKVNSDGDYNFYSIEETRR